MRRKRLAERSHFPRRHVLDGPSSLCAPVDDSERMLVTDGLRVCGSCCHQRMDGRQWVNDDMTSAEALDESVS